MKKVRVTIASNGRVSAEAEGFTGSSCEEATAFLDTLFGVGKKDYKPEYYQEECNNITNGLPSGYCG